MQTSMIEKSLTNTYISTGNTVIDQVMKGGIPCGSINIIMGDSSGSMSWGIISSTHS